MEIIGLESGSQYGLEMDLALGSSSKSDTEEENGKEKQKERKQNKDKEKNKGCQEKEQAKKPQTIQMLNHRLTPRQRAMARDKGPNDGSFGCLDGRKGRRGVGLRQGQSDRRSLSRFTQRHGIGRGHGHSIRHVRENRVKGDGCRKQKTAAFVRFLRI